MNYLAKQLLLNTLAVTLGFLIPFSFIIIFNI